MTKEMVQVYADVTQIKEAIEYKGTISFDDCSFKYSMKFGINLWELNQIMGENPEEFIRQAHLVVTTNKGTPVQLTKDRNLLFLVTAGKLVLDFFNAPQTRERNNDYPLNILIDYMGGSGSIGMSTKYEMQRIPQLEELLSKYHS